ncbi:MAG: hypothetical protein OEQ90_04370 [Gammaproteobacteria bacterium]|nr:hypothetical protein [Gammaproteobacteria bacterium]
MKKTPNPNPLRLRKKHGDGSGIDVTAADGERLVRAQSMRNAIVAGLIVIIVFCILWVSLTVQTNRVFPWMTVVLGAMLGLSIRRAGRGVDWRFPTLAAVMAFAGAIVGNIVLGASTTAGNYGLGTMEILRSVTSMTWPLFFDEVWNVADGFFAVVAAAFAAFFANRRLSRAEFYALRRWREESDGH